MICCANAAAIKHTNERRPVVARLDNWLSQSIALGCCGPSGTQVPGGPLSLALKAGRKVARVSPEVLIIVGQALHGRDWQSELARDLQVKDSIVRRWAAGEATIPTDVAHDLARLCRKHGVTLGSLADTLTRLG